MQRTSYFELLNYDFGRKKHLECWWMVTGGDRMIFAYEVQFYENFVHLTYRTN